MASIFISYRRSDSAHVVDRLHKELRGYLPRKNIFLDIDTIPAGAQFDEIIASTLAKCDIVLAIMGGNWLACEDVDGTHRLDNPEDFVRRELIMALERKDVLVVPVLLDDMEIPEAHLLPKPLQGLTKRNAVRLRRIGFTADVDAIATSIGLHRRVRKLLWLLVVAGICILVIFIAWVALPSSVVIENNPSLDSPTTEAKAPSEKQAIKELNFRIEQIQKTASNALRTSDAVLRPLEGVQTKISYWVLRTAYLDLIQTVALLEYGGIVSPPFWTANGRQTMFGSITITPETTPAGRGYKYDEFANLSFVDLIERILKSKDITETKISEMLLSLRSNIDSIKQQVESAPSGTIIGFYNAISNVDEGSRDFKPHTLVPINVQHARGAVSWLNNIVMTIKILNASEAVRKALPKPE